MSLPEAGASLAAFFSGLTVNGEERQAVFDEPWQAKAFAMTVLMHERGAFTWAEWAEALSVECAGSDDYYRAWLRALERLLTDKAITAVDLVSATADDWQRAARATPHGRPISLSILSRNQERETTDKPS